MKGFFLIPVALMFVSVALSASTSSCDSAIGASSYLNASQKPVSSCGYQDYRCMARADAVQAGIDPDLFERQINMESGFNPNAYSSAGAEGISQFEPSTAQGLGINPYDPVQALRGAAQLMASYNAKYGDYKMALAAYQCGTGCLQSAMRNCSYWYYCVPSSTQRYINVITE
jgi:soluble lytic murein transglycosylase-like protein